jgi:L-methionine (R)-S-oxide reductase
LKEAKTQVVPDVEAFPGHIACDANSKSEIVVPILQGGQVLNARSQSSIDEVMLTRYQVVAIIDIDCAELNGFDEVDQKHLEEFAELLAGGCDFA